MSDSAPMELHVPPNAHVLMRADRHMVYARHMVEGMLGRFGVTWCGYLLLSEAARHDRMSYRELAAGAGLSSGTVPVLVDTMCQEDLLTRSAESSRQGGRVLVTMTDQGHQHVEAIHHCVEPVAKPLLYELVELLRIGDPSDLVDSSR